MLPTPAVAQYLRNRRHYESDTPLDHNLVNHQGSLLPVQTRISHLQGDDGDAIGLLLIARSLNDKGRCEESTRKLAFYEGLSE